MNNCLSKAPERFLRGAVLMEPIQETVQIPIANARRFVGRDVGGDHLIAKHVELAASCKQLLAIECALVRLSVAHNANTDGCQVFAIDAACSTDPVSRPGP